MQAKVKKRMITISLMMETNLGQNHKPVTDQGLSFFLPFVPPALACQGSNFRTLTAC